MPDATSRRRRGRSWVPVVLACAAASLLLAVLGAPSPVLFGALGGSLILAVSGRALPTLSPRLAVMGQALLGASTGASVDPQTLADLASHAVPVATVVVATIAASILIGQIQRLQEGVSAATASFAFIAGGASGITAVARDLGADDRVVAVVQYLRVLIIIVGMPIVAALWFGVPSQAPTDGVGPWAAVAGVVDVTWGGLLFTLVSVAVGLVLARLVRFPAADLLGPLVVAAVLAVGDGYGLFPVHVPALVEQVAFALIGLQVGLRFTRASLVAVARLLPLALTLIFVLIAVSAGLGVLLAAWIGVSPLDGYLATTPGGLYAVLVVAGIAGGDVTFVLGVQMVRLLLVLALAPVLAAVFRRAAGRSGPAQDGDDEL